MGLIDKIIQKRREVGILPLNEQEMTVLRRKIDGIDTEVQWKDLADTLSPEATQVEALRERVYTRILDDVYARQESVRIDQAVGEWRYRSGFPKKHAEVAVLGPPLEWPEPDLPGRIYDLLVKNRSVLLLGPHGTGKTQLTCAVTYRLACRCWRMRYSADIVSDFRQKCWNDKTISEDGYFADLARLHLLVLDQFGQRRVSQDENLILGRIIDAVYGADIPLVVISNDSLDVFKTSVSASTYDRLREMAELIECAWPSYRAREK
jgi:hypothetical protein